MEIKGEVADIIFQNETNGYTVAVFDTDDEETTIVGFLPFVKQGDTLDIIGRFVTHKQYGQQFQVQTFKKMMPDSLPALEKYLANGNIKGIGESTAKKIVRTFGENTVNVFKFEPEKLAQIKGISIKKAKEMSESFIENWEVWQIFGFLEKFGISTENAKKVYDELGTDAIEKIKQNPYILIDIVRGVDFRQVDQVALELGITYDDLKRVECCIKYGLIRATNNGHSCVVEDNLIEFVISLLDVSKETVEDGLIDLKAKEGIVIEERDGVNWVYLEDFYEVEKEIARRIKGLIKAPNMKKIDNMEKALQKAEKKSNIELSEKQKEAILSINESNVTIITGGPGTGKTTIIKTIIDIYEARKKKVVLAAPTGRAAKKMTEATGKEASTLHRLLGIGIIDDDGAYKKNEHRGEPIDADVIVVDELSMVDMFLMDSLLDCIYKGTKLILVGDTDQLASVGPGSVLKDLINSGEINTVKLDKIFRQAAKSKIILNAHRVNNGEGFIGKDEVEEDSKDDFFFIKENSTERALQQIISLSSGRLEKYGNYDFIKNIQVLTPTKKGTLGTRELNKVLQEKLNPADGIKKEKKFGNIIFREGDRVMQIKNNYDMTWEKEPSKSNSYNENIYFNENGNETGAGVFNGEIGIISKIREKDKVIEVEFDDGKVAWYEFGELDQLEHSYAMTIHKAQGSEFDVVIMVIPNASPKLLTRNLLYTGITRAKKLLIVIGSENVVNYMIQNIDSKKRNTGLQYKLSN